MTASRRALVVLGTTVVAASAIAFAAVRAGDDGQESTPPTTEAEPVALGASTTTTYSFPETYMGEVWVTVSSDRSAAATVDITWGPWRATVDHPGGDVSYQFTKGIDEDLTASPPVEVLAPEGFTVEFGYGAAPEGSVDLDGDFYAWQEVEDGS